MNTSTIFGIWSIISCIFMISLVFIDKYDGDPRNLTVLSWIIIAPIVLICIPFAVVIYLVGLTWNKFKIVSWFVKE